MRRELVLLFLLISLSASVCLGQTDNPPASGAGPAQQAVAEKADKKEITTYSLPPEKYEKAVAYSRTRYWLHFIETGYSLLVLMSFLAFRIGGRFRDWAEAASRRRFVQAIIFVPILLGVLAVLELPFDVNSHRLARQYDISIQGWGSWFWDWTKAEFIELGILSVLLYFFYGVVRRSPRRWWLYSGFAVFSLAVFFIFLSTGCSISSRHIEE
jgi:hypothetical protein